DVCSSDLTAFAAIPCFVPSFHRANEKDRQHKLTVFWSPEGGQIRTFNLVQGDLLCPFLIVEGHKHVVIIYHHAVDKTVNQPPPAFQGVDVHFAELENIELNLLSGELRLPDFFFHDAQLQLFFGFFHLIQPTLDRCIESTGLDGVQQIVDCLFGICQLTAQGGQLTALLPLDRQC